MRAAEVTAFWDWALLELLLGSGLRVEEACELTTLDILKRQLGDGRVYYLLHVKPSKFDRARVIPIGDQLGPSSPRSSATCGPSTAPPRCRRATDATSTRRRHCPGHECDGGCSSGLRGLACLECNGGYPDETIGSAMSIDVAALAQAGAQVIVTAMATETWTQVRARIGRLFGRGDEQLQQQALDDLDETRAALKAAAGDEDARDSQVELRALLKARLRADPELAAQFAVLVEEVAAEVAAAPQVSTVTQRARADHGGMVIQAGRDANTGRLPPAGWSGRR
ncbi:hypothetical protein [Micromonospora sp. NPDC005806]|uniref:hypothetical protein n=1 Tax=Micromonospora sp. NPDC005806 TaxID=3364234 RepID=UPI0036BEEE13